MKLSNKLLIGYITAGLIFFVILTLTANLW